MSAQPHHDSAAYLTVAWTDKSARWPAGYVVRRTCACHKDENVSVRFATAREAYRCMWALDADCCRRLAKESGT